MTEVMVTKELLDSLHEAGWHLVTRTEWYEIQSKLALLRNYADHTQFCGTHCGGTCDCGYTEAVG